jgi:hypothetical protein
MKIKSNGSTPERIKPSSDSLAPRTRILDDIAEPSPIHAGASHFGIS